ncbi:oxidoreductase [Paenibacillus baekrokdamisoli]|uniref:Oxidoreductase n=1 Tax=Paenibacillus baekrokdamisoli TaxID=1712516 RepID=A0A3G9IVE4_9BACL|nr:aldo/keto reductase [Paenibacillus baekrokdamisoli]MBB3068175.1 aryl-alcohol dehydrogenase-like predicted oxidoreductase [Paenibacillus baekrokdamisoli]BBH22780.1 oxidoreductase [Paenibacillus baekrokdamisoli]
MEHGSLRQFGNSDLQLSPLGLGCWQFSKGSGMVGKFWPVLDDDVIRDIVRISLEGGINWFDTAEVYGGGQSEEMLADALNVLGDDAAGIHVATKWWPVMRSSANIPKTIDERLRRLKGWPIDLYQVHQPYSFSSATSEMHEMSKLVKLGKIKHVGVSNFSAAKMYEADKALRESGLRLVSNQVKYNLLDRRIERNGIMEAAKELGVAIIAYSPLEQGILSGKFHKNPELIKHIQGPRKWAGSFKPEGLKRTQPLISRLDELAVKYEASASQVALNWLIHAHGETVFAIPGASKPQHAQENVKAMCFSLSSDEISELRELSASCGR